MSSATIASSPRSSSTIATSAYPAAARRSSTVASPVFSIGTSTCCSSTYPVGPAGVAAAATASSTFASSTGFPLEGSAQQVSLNEHERSFGFFVAATPGASGSVTVSIGERTYAGVTSFSLGLPLAAVLDATTRTSVLYADRSSVRVAYQLRDAAGESRVSQDQLSLSLRLRFADADFTAGCSLPAQVSGIGECASTLAGSWFGIGSRSAAVEVAFQYGDGPTVVASGGVVVLEAAVARASLEAAGMVASLPLSPRYVGDEFDVTIHAHTGPENFALKGWNLRLQYDVGVLSVVQRLFSSVFQAPTFADDPVAGTFDAVTTGIGSTQTNAQVQNKTALYLMTLRFRVVGGAGDLRRVLNGTVGAMVNQGTQRYLTNAVMSVTDQRGGLQSFGVLSVDNIVSVGVLAYLATGSLVNTAALDGQPITSSVNVVQLYDRAGTASVPSAEYTCTSSNASVATVSASCEVVLTDQLEGGGAVLVHVLSSEGGSIAQVPLAVWFPISVSAEVEDAELSLVVGVDVPSNCGAGGSRYQQTSAAATATFGGMLPEGMRLDVSDLVSFSADDASVAVASGRTVSGVGLGSTLVRAGVAAGGGVTQTPASVAVSANGVTVSGLRAAVVTSAAWVRVSPTVVPWLPLANLTAAVQLFQSFSEEGETGDLFAYAVFSDGNERRLPSSELSVRSLTTSLSVGLSGSTWSVLVEVGAVRECGSLLAVEWRVCNETAAAGTASVNLKMPSVVAIQATVLASRLTTPGDSASVAPISVASSATVRVLVDFSDNTQRDFSTDSRTHVEIDAADSSCARIDGINTLVVLRGATCERITVHASVPALAAGINGSASVPLTGFASLELLLLPYPSFSGYEQVTMASLRRLGCSSSYQRGQLLVTAHLSDASTVAVSSASSVVSLTPSVLTTQWSAAVWVLAPQAAGTAVVNATFDVQSATLSFPVSDEEVRFTSVALGVSGVDAGSDFTFGAQVGTERTGTTQLEFEDGTRLDDLAAVEWTTVSSFVEFETDDESTINVSGSSGAFVLQANSWARTSLIARSVCDSEVLATVLVAANLEPAVGDVDLGSEQGLQFQQVAQTLQVPVRANVVDGVLVNYQVEVVFDPSALAAETCSSGALEGFTCTLNDPLERAKLIATDTGSQVTGSSVLLGTFTLAVQASSVTLLSGTIVELVRNTNGGTTEVRTSDVPIVAGRGYADVQTGGRRLHRAAKAPRALPSSPTSRKRQLETACVVSDGCQSGRWGDVSGDCKLTAYDALLARQVLIGQLAFGDLCPWAQQQLDPTLDGEAFTVEDAIYLQLAAANKYRFLANVSVDSTGVVAGRTDALDVTVLVLDDLSVPAEARTTVRFEVGFAQSGGGTWMGGAGQPVYLLGSSGGTAGTSSNWIVNAVHVGGGAYRAAVYPSGGWELVAADAGVAVMIETEDALGQGEAERNFPFLGSNAEPYAALTPACSTASIASRSSGRIRTSPSACTAATIAAAGGTSTI
ncbi:hypothetical protein AB1Y20_002800 [Prymnesium parvum]|uniref:Transmembrane protein family 132 fourth domain-containing protein n=1 Tax=Prymnesium parvum TaxID=97485 RepID=A0AB34JA57_PRYPA